MSLFYAVTAACSVGFKCGREICFAFASQYSCRFMGANPVDVKYISIYVVQGFPVHKAGHVYVGVRERINRLNP